MTTKKVWYMKCCSITVAAAPLVASAALFGPGVSNAMMVAPRGGYEEGVDALPKHRDYGNPRHWKDRKADNFKEKLAKASLEEKRACESLSMTQSQLMPSELVGVLEEIRENWPAVISIDLSANYINPWYTRYADFVARLTDLLCERPSLKVDFSGGGGAESIREDVLERLKALQSPYTEAQLDEISKRCIVDEE